jgi:hypothetical protein
MTIRPSEFSDETMTLICERMAEGQTLRQICKDPELPERSTVYRWLEAQKDFRARYARAREALMDWYADEIIEVAWDSTKDTISGTKGQDLCNHEWIARSRLKVDTLKFLMAKLHPGRYGDKLTPEAKEEEAKRITFRFEDDQPRQIQRIIVEAPESVLHERIRELEEQLGMRAGEPAPVRLLTHDPGPLPRRMDRDIAIRMAQLIRDYVPADDQRDPMSIFDEALDACKRALMLKYGAGKLLEPV